MTDREAIRRLAGIVEDLSERVGDAYAMADTRKLIMEWYQSEPAAPTPENCADYSRGYADGLAAARELNARSAPTVTREQAERAERIVMAAYNERYANCMNPPPEAKLLFRSRPVFFRAVAASLDREA